MCTRSLVRAYARLVVALKDRSRSLVCWACRCLGIVPLRVLEFILIIIKLKGSYLNVINTSIYRSHTLRSVALCGASWVLLRARQAYSSPEPNVLQTVWNTALAFRAVQEETRGDKEER